MDVMAGSDIKGLLIVKSASATTIVSQACSSVLGRAGFESAGQVWHVAWGGTACLGNHLEISKAYAECLALPEGSTVSVKALPEVLPATSVSVEPNHIDDWEIVEAQAQYIEDTMLSQVFGMRLPHVQPKCRCHAI